jgi:hypothetical protein
VGDGFVERAVTRAVTRAVEFVEDGVAAVVPAHGGSGDRPTGGARDQADSMRLQPILVSRTVSIGRGSSSLISLYSASRTLPGGISRSSAWTSGMLAAMICSFSVGAARW